MNDILQVQGINSKGFGIIPKLVMQDRRLTTEAKAIYSYFCSYAGAGRTAFPGRNKIISDLGLSVKRYYKHFELLKQCGYIKTEQEHKDGRYQRNIYTLLENIPCSQNDHTVQCSQNECTQIECAQNEDSNNNRFENQQSFINNSPSIVRAMEQGAGQIEEMYANIPKTFGDRMTAISNETGKLLSRVASSGAFDTINRKLEQFHAWLQSPEAIRAVDTIAQLFAGMSWVIGGLVGAVGGFIGLLTSMPNVLETIAWLVGSIGAAVLVTLVPSLWAAATAVWAQAVAWLAVNWPVLLVVGAILGLLMLILKFPEVLGYVVGGFVRFGAEIYNIVAYVYNIYASLGEFIANVFNDPLYSAKRLFVNFADSVFGLVKGLAQAIDAVFGSNLAGGIAGLQAKMQSWLGEMPEGYKVWARMEYQDPAAAQAWGQQLGTGWANNLRNNIGGIKDQLAGGAHGFGMPDNMTITGGELDKVGRLGGEVNIAKEDLKYLLDASTRRFVNQIQVTQVVPVDVKNIFGDVRETADVRTVADELKRILLEQSAGTAVVVT